MSKNLIVHLILAHLALIWASKQFDGFTSTTMHFQGKLMN